ncbi:hypothetical protein B0H10DRAFT_2007284 [Mycena sp. CBHHK59/15]|nr:hypothetical protein B0H10DRAFT_2007284 [Mycena sp. CBHHK59/15]
MVGLAGAVAVWVWQGWEAEVESCRVQGRFSVEKIMDYRLVHLQRFVYAGGHGYCRDSVCTRAMIYLEIVEAPFQARESFVDVGSGPNSKKDGKHHKKQQCVLSMQRVINQITGRVLVVAHGKQGEQSRVLAWGNQSAEYIGESARHSGNKV